MVIGDYRGVGVGGEGAPRGGVGQSIGVDTKAPVLADLATVISSCQVKATGRPGDLGEQLALLSPGLLFTLILVTIFLLHLLLMCFV